MSAAANLSPKNPLLLALLIGGGLYLVLRRPSAAGTPVVRPGVPASAYRTDQIPILGPVLAAISQALPTRVSDAEMSAREAGRAAVRAGDPYYGGDYGLGGMSIDVWQHQVNSDAAAWSSYVGTADDATGDPYNPGW